MSKSPLFNRKSLDQICSVPEEIIDVYVVEHHIWADAGSDDAKKKRKAEPKTVREFLIDPVRPLLNDVLRQLAAPYDPSDKMNPVGQGWWIQAEFGSGKSHLLSFIGALALGDKDAWEIVRNAETEAKKGKRESIYQFYENGLKKKSSGKSKGIFVAVQTLVGQGGGTIGVSDTGRRMTDYILDAVQKQYVAENGKTISLYPVEVLADRFENEDYERYHKDLAKFLKDPKYFDEEEQEDIGGFLEDLRGSTDPMVRRDCGERLWRFYREYLKTTPDIPMESEPVLQHMVKTLVGDGYDGVLIILDEVSLFMKNRTEDQRTEDEKTLVVLSNRLAKNDCLPVWTICSAQQAIESKMGVKNIIANDRLKHVSLLQDERNYYDIVLSKARTVTSPESLDAYHEDYRRGFTWPEAEGRPKFDQFFPFYPHAIDVLRAVSYHLTTVRSSVHFMHQTMKTQCKAKSNELISLWQMFDDVVKYEEDPSGTTAGIAAISAKFNDEWKAYQAGRRAIGQATKGRLKVYASRCEKILKTLFLNHIARTAPNGLSVEQITNSVMEWQDHDKGQQADAQDNLDHYEVLCEEIDQELTQVSKVGTNYVFNPIGGGVDVPDLFQRARTEAENSPVLQQKAWEQLLSLSGWDIQTPLMTMDLAYGTESVFHEVAPAEQVQDQVLWHGRAIKGMVYMRDLLDIASKGMALPPINSADNDHDFAVFISNRPCGDKVIELAKRVKDPRAVFWTPSDLSPSEKDRLYDFAAYRKLVADFRGKETEDAKEVLSWVASRLKNEVGTIANIVRTSYSRGRICAADHGDMQFTCEGDLSAIITPLVGQVLDATYESSKLKFDAPAPFSDAEGIKVINGIVRVGEIPKGTKPNKDISAADNYGYALGIMKKSAQRKLDPSACEFAKDIEDWIEAQVSQGNAPIGVESFYKNFTGINGPNGTNYGLSRRMVEVYLLCLVRQGKIRISLSGKAAATTPHIDYSNIADETFNAALLGGMTQVHPLKAPEGWSVLASYAAVLLDDEEVKNIQKDTEINAALKRLADYRSESQPEVATLVSRLDDLFADIGQTNPVVECMASWKTYFDAKIDPDEPIPHLLNALDNAFGYKAYQDNKAKQTEVDDLATQKRTWERAGLLATHDREIRAAHCYSQVTVDKGGILKDLPPKTKSLGKKLAKLEDLTESEAKLQTQLLDPLADVIRIYTTRFLQAFVDVTGKCEAVRQAIRALPASAEFTAIGMLATIEALGGIDTASLQRRMDECEEGLFATELTRNDVERRLKERPDPEGCPLVVDQAGTLIEAAEQAVQQATGAVRAVLASASNRLCQPALRSLLEQGKEEAFIADVLAAPNVDALADLLAERLPADPANAKMLAKYLKEIQMRLVRLQDFQPSKSSLEQDDLDTVVNEFRSFLLAAFRGSTDGQSVIVELKQ